MILLSFSLRGKERLTEQIRAKLQKAEPSREQSLKARGEKGRIVFFKQWSPLEEHPLKLMSHWLLQDALRGTDDELPVCVEQTYIQTLALGPALALE